MPSTPTCLSTGTACRICRALDAAAVRRGHQLEPPGDVGRRVSRNSGTAAPGQVRELEAAGSVGPARSQSKTPTTRSPSKHHVVRRDVVVPDQVRAVDREVPPRALADEPVDRVVQLAGPAGQVLELRVGEHGGVEVDDRAGQVGQHLAAAGVDAQHLRHGPQPAHPVEQRGAPPGVHGPVGRRTVCADPDRTADVAALQGVAVEQQLAQLGEERQVRASHADLVELLGTEPAQRVVLVRHRLAVDELGHRDPQRVARLRSARAPSSMPVTATPQPSSSRTSRTTAAAGSSPGSTLPPGNSHLPAASGGCVRRVASTRPCRTTAAPTTRTSAGREAGTVRMMPVSLLPSDCRRGASRAAPRPARRRAPAAQRRPCRGGRRARRPARRPGRAARRARRPGPPRARRPGPRARGRVGLPVGPRGHALAALVAAGHHHVGRLGHRRGGRRRRGPAGPDDELLLPRGRRLLAGRAADAGGPDRPRATSATATCSSSSRSCATTARSTYDR